MGIAYLAAALAVVPGLLLLFNRLSRPPQPPTRPPTAGERVDDGDDVPFADPGSQSVADEAERWLQGQS